jgi:hypothetical protein
VPETTVHKHNDPLLTKNEVGLTEKFLVSLPACDFVRSQQLDKPKFSCRVSTAAD